MNQQYQTRMSCWSAAGAVLFFTLAPLAVAAAPVKIVVPNYLADMEGPERGDISNFGPFRQQQLYFASEFAALPETPHAIIGTYARADRTVTSPSSFRYDDLMIRVSTTSEDELRGMFAANHGANVTTVFSGPLSMSTQATGPLQGPRDFDNYHFPYGIRPFVYDPDMGNLVVEMSSSSGPIGSAILDAYRGDPGAYLGAGSANATTGSVQDVGFPIQFEFVPVSPADFNLDFAVDDQDLALWEEGYGNPGSRENGDADGDAVITGADYLIWQREFVAGVPGLAAELGVPEPTTLVLGCAALAVVGALSRRR